VSPKEQVPQGRPKIARRFNAGMIAVEV